MNERESAAPEIGTLLHPPAIIPVTGPLVFLAGPIQGARDWQVEAISHLRDECPGLPIASPRFDYPPGEFIYEHQVDWETYYLGRAALRGVIMFWLACETDHRCERAYAQTTRFELAEWKLRHERDGIHLVLGIEEGFSNARYIRRRFAQDCETTRIYSTLRETCLATVEIVRRLQAESFIKSVQ